jgi:hypothetical protein
MTSVQTDRDSDMRVVAAAVRWVLFCVFFTGGATAIVLSALADELAVYYEQRGIPAQIEARNERIRRLCAQYDQQIAQLKTDPSLAAKLKTFTFRDKPDAEDTVFPQASAGNLAAAREALMQEIEGEPIADPVPTWVSRCSESKNRRTLFVAGVGLILITFIFFGSTRPTRPEKTYKKKQTTKEGQA